MHHLTEVKKLVRTLRPQGFKDITIRKLILTEMPLEEEA